MNRKQSLFQRLKSAGSSLRGIGKAALAGGAAAAVLAGNVARGIWGSASGAIDQTFNKTEVQDKKGVVEMKKSTLVGIIVALAAVAGMLAALYFYLLRREKELQEYEQLLFSEDNDNDYTDFDIPEDIITQE